MESVRDLLKEQERYSTDLRKRTEESDLERQAAIRDLHEAKKSLSAAVVDSASAAAARIGSPHLGNPPSTSHGNSRVDSQSDAAVTTGTNLGRQMALAGGEIDDVHADCVPIEEYELRLGEIEVCL
jgi:hypothetical protein